MVNKNLEVVETEIEKGITGKRVRNSLIGVIAGTGAVCLGAFLMGDAVASKNAPLFYFSVLPVVGGCTSLICYSRRIIQAFNEVTSTIQKLYSMRDVD